MADPQEKHWIELVFRRGRMVSTDSVLTLRKNLEDTECALKSYIEIILNHLASIACAGRRVLSGVDG